MGEDSQPIFAIKLPTVVRGGDPHIIRTKTELSRLSCWAVWKRPSRTLSRGYPHVKLLPFGSSRVIGLHFGEVLEIIMPMLNHNYAAGFALAVLAEYFIPFGDLSLFPTFVEVVFQCIQDDDCTIGPDAVTTLGRCFEAVDCEPLFLGECYRRISESLRHKADFENDALRLFDHALIAFVKLIRLRAAFFDANEAISIIIHALPPCGQCDEIDLVTEFLIG
jgi:hypothetical protein